MLLLAVVGLVFFVNPTQYKDLIAAKIEEKIHRPFAINGDISWRLLPSVGFTLKSVQIGQATGSETLADIKEVHVYPELKTLLNKQINIKALSLLDTKIYLSKQTTVTISNIDAQIQMDMKNNAPKGQMDVIVHSAQIDGDIFSGNLNAKANFLLDGALNGSGNFEMDNGVVRGLDLSYWLKMGESLITSKNLVQLATLPLEAVTLSNQKQTRFNKLTGTFTINNNIFKNDDLVVDGSGFYATAHGNIDLVKQYINYALRVSSSQNANVQIPLTLSGNLNHPKIGIDPKGIQALLVGTAKAGVTDTLNQSGSIVGAGQDVGQAVKDTLKSLFH
jgi:uncharacterized protein involved in outer membrane biogenesis